MAMNYYIEVTLIKTDDFSFYGLWSKLYAQLHLALVEYQKISSKVDIGVSFPQYRFDDEKSIGFLGEKLRIFANNEADLAKLNLQVWFNQIFDYVHMTTIKEVPQHKVSGYAIFQRKQVKTSAIRLARHEERKGRYTYESALAHYQKFVTTSTLPYIQMKSLTSDRFFKLFVEKKCVSEFLDTQVFGTYGLSSTSSIPEF